MGNQVLYPFHSISIIGSVPALACLCDIIILSYDVTTKVIREKQNGERKMCVLLNALIHTNQLFLFSL